MSSKSKRRGRGAGALGALAVAGIVSVGAPSVARADETSRSAARGSSMMVALARALIAELLDHPGAFTAMTGVGSASMRTSQPLPASAQNPQANAASDCGCSRAGNGKGPPKRIACDGAEAAAARASGELTTTCAAR